MKNTFSIKARLASFKNAWRGVKVFVRQEHNAWIHCAMSVLVIIAGTRKARNRLRAFFVLI